MPAASRMLTRMFFSLCFQRAPERMCGSGASFHCRSNTNVLAGGLILLTRDNCRCAECINQATMQRNFRIFDDMDVEPETIRESEDGLEIVWKSPRTGSHTSFYKWNFISRYLIPNSRAFPEYRFVHSLPSGLRPCHAENSQMADLGLRNCPKPAHCGLRRSHGNRFEPRLGQGHGLHRKFYG